MATSVVSKTDLVGVQSIAYMRAITIKIDVNGARPNSVMHVFFDNQLVDNIAYPVGGVIGSPVTTNAYGQATIMVDIPGGRFATGTKNILVSDTADITKLYITGSTYGFASGNFNSIGVDKIYQTTITTTTVNTVVQYLVDPLAQSFFTYGKKGGVFLSSIDLFFENKDASIPVRVEIRNMVNGFPSPLNTSDANLVCSKNPVDIITSEDASVATRFTFKTPIYLKEDSDYCFVIFSSSNQYNVFTSKLGEKSFETGRTIFEQPYVGSMFKSENNVTWTAEQSEDIKFNINIAQFNISSDAQLEFNIQVPQVAVPGLNFYTTSGSGIIQYTQAFQHALAVGDKINVAADILGTFNGILGSYLNGTFTVVSIIDEYTLTFDCGHNATITGLIVSGQYVKNVIITNGGSGYSSTTLPVVSFVSPSGTGATAVVTVAGGVITAITVTASGSGYAANPIVSITSSAGGSGASATAICDAMFTVNTNKFAHNVMPSFITKTVSDTSIYGTLSTTIGNFAGGNLVSYTAGNTYNVTPNVGIALNQNSMIASRFNEYANMSNAPSMKLRYNLHSTNPNISPVINLNQVANVYAYGNTVRSHSGEDLTSSNAYGTVSGIVLSSGGSGYTVAPTVSIISTNGSGSGATATATLTGSSVTGITVTAPGSGYSAVPLVVVTPASGGGSGATAQSQLTPFNTEIDPNNGIALSRYITNPITIQTVSTGISLFSNIYSVEESSVDWYIRTSLSGSGANHLLQNWKILSCDKKRNLSTFVGEYYDYEFYTNGLAPFDTYDLKAVMRSTNPAKVPTISQYRVIIVA